jgi:ABC-type transport system involved in cytochrome c biogenesis permease subunit
MAVKWTILGGLIVAAMVFYMAAGVLLFVAKLVRLLGKSATQGKTARSDDGATALQWLGSATFALGSVAAGVAFVVRWIEVDHVPLQNMFEVFVCLGMLMWPLSLFCRRVLGAGCEWANALLGAIFILFPAAFVFSADPQHLPPALQSFLFVPHVAAYMISYVIMFMAVPPAFLRLFVEKLGDDLPNDLQAHRLVILGFPLLTLGLALGAWWGKIAWGDYWNWDPKELWSLVSWLLFLGYFHVRYMVGRKYPRLLSVLILAGVAAIIITLIWVNLSRVFGGMHSYAT